MPKAGLRQRQRLNDLTETEIKDFLTAKDSDTSASLRTKIYRHYLDRTSENQPVMYLLYPSSEESGQVAFVIYR